MKTTSLELSKQLKANGFPQNNSEFYWNEAHQNRLSNGEWDTVPTRLLPKHHYFGTSPKDSFFAAPTSDEILDELPRELYEKPGKLFWLQLETNSDGQGWSCQYFNPNFGVKHFEEADTKVEGCGQMYLYLASHGLLKGGKEEDSK